MFTLKLSVTFHIANHDFLLKLKDYIKVRANIEKRKVHWCSIENFDSNHSVSLFMRHNK